MHFEPQLRHGPDGVVLLDFGDRDPGGLLLGRVIQHSGYPAGVCRRVFGYLRVYLRE